MRFFYLRKIFDLHRTLRSNKYYGRIFNTDIYNLKADIYGCKSVLDLGCGPNSILKYCKNLSYSVGVEAFEPYVNISKCAGIHKEYISSDIMDVNFSDNSFDAVIMIDVVEHLTKDDAIKLIGRAHKWAKKKIVVMTPNGFQEQLEYDGNENQIHKCGFSPDELRRMGFKVSGVGGVKLPYFRKNNKIKAYINYIIYFIALSTQIFIHNFPSISSGLYAVKLKNNK